MRELPLLLMLAVLWGCAPAQTVPPAPAPETVATYQPAIGSNPPAAQPAPAGIAYHGGDGSSIEKAIVIAGARNEKDGVASEYTWLSKNHPGYGMKRQALLQAKGKFYDRLDFVTAQGEAKSVFFDISGFFGKF